MSRPLKQSRYVWDQIEELWQFWMERHQGWETAGIPFQKACLLLNGVGDEVKLSIPYKAFAWHSKILGREDGNAIKISYWYLPWG